MYSAAKTQRQVESPSKKAGGACDDVFIGRAQPLPPARLAGGRADEIEHIGLPQEEIVTGRFGTVSSNPTCSRIPDSTPCSDPRVFG
jgi:hypothetical protein